MAEILPRHYIISGIIFTMMIVGIFSVLNLVDKGGSGDGSDTLSNFVPGNELVEFNRSFNKIDNLTQDVNRLKQSVSDLKPENTLEIISLPVAFVQSAWATMKIVIGMFSFMDSALEGLSALLGVPSWIIDLIVLLVIVVIVFGILAVIFGKDA